MLRPIYLLVSLLLLVPPTRAQQENANEQIQYSTKKLEFEDVNVATVVSWLRRVGLTIPVELDGRVSVKLTADIPWGALLETRAWRLSGSLSSPHFQVNDYRLDDVNLALRYREGVLYLDELKATIPEPNKKTPAETGFISGKASMELEPRGKLTATFNATSVPLDSFSRTIASMQSITGRLSGSLSAEAEVDRLRDLNSWNINGPAQLEGFSFRKSPPADAFLQLQLKDSELAVRDFSATQGATSLAGEARLVLVGKFAWSVNGELATNETAQVLQFLNGFVKGNNIARIARQVKLEKFEATAQLEGTLAPQVVRISGHAAVNGLSLAKPEALLPRSKAPIRLESLELDYALRQPNRLEISNLHASLLDGEVSGKFRVNLGAGIGGSTSLELRQIDLTNLASILGAPQGVVKGRTDADIRLTISPGTFDEPEKWLGTGSLRPGNVDIYQRQFRRIQPIELRLQEGLLTVSKIDMELDGAPLAGTLSLGIQAPWDFTASLSARQLDIDQVATISQLKAYRGRLGGRISLKTEMSGTVKPLEFTSQGTVVADNLRFENHVIDEIDFRFKQKPEFLEVLDLNASLYRGKLTGQLKLPLERQQKTSAALAWQDIDAGKLIGEFIDLQGDLAGKTTGKASVNIPPDARDDPSRWDLTAKARLEELTLDGTTITTLEAQLKQQDGKFDYSASGTLFDGTLKLEGSRDQNQAVAGLALLGDADLTLKDASISKIAPSAAGSGSPFGAAAGTLEVNLHSEMSTGSWGWQGTLRLADVDVKGRPISSELSLNLVGSQQSVTVPDLSGEIAGGILGGRGVWAYNGNRESAFRIRLRSASFEKLAQMVGYNEDLVPNGPVDLELQVWPGATWHMVGTASMLQGDLNEVRLRSVRLPVTIDWNPTTGRMRVLSTNSSAAVARGRIVGRLTARRGARWTIDGKFRFYRIDLNGLMREFGSHSSYGNGQLSGTLAISGRNVRSLADVQATLRADLENASSGSIPVVDELRRFVPGIGLGGATQFSEGRLEARLVRGVFQLDKFFLASRLVQIYVTGRINLFGRLRLEAVVSTGELGNPVLAETLLLQIISVPAAPITALQAANDFLSHRTIHLAIHGTLRRPIIRPRPMQSLPQEVVRFFLRRATGGLASTASEAVSASKRNQ